MESDVGVKTTILAALKSISGVTDNPAFYPRWSQSYEDGVLSDVRKRYPHLFPSPLIPIGTNALASGTLLYDPQTTQQWGKVLEVDRAYEFPDGTNRPGVLLKTKQGEHWVPRENVTKFLVPAR